MKLFKRFRFTEDEKRRVFQYLFGISNDVARGFEGWSRLFSALLASPLILLDAVSQKREKTAQQDESGKLEQPKMKESLLKEPQEAI
jgi:hypothetical protein